MADSKDLEIKWKEKGKPRDFESISKLLSEEGLNPEQIEEVMRMSRMAIPKDMYKKYDTPTYSRKGGKEPEYVEHVAQFEKIPDGFKFETNKGKIMRVEGGSMFDDTTNKKMPKNKSLEDQALNAYNKELKIYYGVKDGESEQDTEQEEQSQKIGDVVQIPEGSKTFLTNGDIATFRDGSWHNPRGKELHQTWQDDATRNYFKSLGKEQPEQPEKSNKEPEPEINEPEQVQDEPKTSQKVIDYSEVISSHPRRKEIVKLLSMNDPIADLAADMILTGKDKDAVHILKNISNGETK